VHLAQALRGEELVFLFAPAALLLISAINRLMLVGLLSHIFRGLAAVVLVIKRENHI